MSTNARSKWRSSMLWHIPFNSNLNNFWMLSNWKLKISFDLLSHKMTRINYVIIHFSGLLLSTCILFDKERVASELANGWTMVYCVQERYSKQRDKMLEAYFICTLFIYVSLYILQIITVPRYCTVYSVQCTVYKEKVKKVKGEIIRTII